MGDDPRKPKWDSAPYWAKFVAMDENGRWMWYEGYPEFDRESGLWNCDHGRLQEAYVEQLEASETLEGRPEGQ